jgi:hypothetical protein
VSSASGQSDLLEWIDRCLSAIEFRVTDRRRRQGWREGRRARGAV